MRVKKGKIKKYGRQREDVYKQQLEHKRKDTLRKESQRKSQKQIKERKERKERKDNFEDVGQTKADQI